MSHAEMEDLYELYVLDLLDEESSAEIRQHLGTDCEVCAARVNDAVKLTAALGSLAPSVPPPPAVRKRIIRLAGKPSSSSQWIYSFAAAAVIAVLFFGWGYQQLSARRTLAAETSDLLRERDALRSAVAILSQSDTRTVKFGANQSAPHGRVFVSGSGGVVFVGSQLPVLSADRAFELWLIPAKGNPVPAGVFKTNASGVSVNVLPQPVNTAGIAALAVSVEPGSGSPQPTTKPILIIPVA